MKKFIFNVTVKCLTIHHERSVRSRAIWPSHRLHLSVLQYIIQYMCNIQKTIHDQGNTSTVTQFSFSTYSGGTPQSTHVTQLMKSLHACNKSKLTPWLSLYCFIGFVTIIICCLAVPFMALSIDQDANNMVVNLDGASAISLFGYRGFGLNHILLINLVSLFCFFSVIFFWFYWPSKYSLHVWCHKTDASSTDVSSRNGWHLQKVVAH